jgi:hypothetical protein
MDLSALERIISSLERSLDSLEILLFWMTALVVIGLVVEYWHEIPDEIKKLREARRFLWRPVCVIVGGILITVGVGGELVVQFIAGDKQTDLRRLNHRIEYELRARAEEARQKANEADERARGFQAQIADSNARVKTAEAQVASANAASREAVAKGAEASAKAEGFRRDIAKANENASQAEERAAEAKLELAKFKLPRTLDTEQQKRVEAKLRPFPATPFELAVDPVPEAISLLKVVDAVLRSSGWINKESAIKDFRFVFTLESGSKVEQEYGSWVVIKLTKGAAVKYGLAANVLVQALRSEGISALGEFLKDDDASPDNIHVMIGTKE